jgi:hypothetical protein
MKDGAGDPVHPPAVAARSWPARVVPEICGNVWFTGGASPGGVAPGGIGFVLGGPFEIVVFTHRRTRTYTIFPCLRTTLPCARLGIRTVRRT